MQTFATIWQRAAERKGGDTALRLLLPDDTAVDALASLGDDRFLSAMCRVINQAGFSWKVIDKKWPEFEQAFLGFSIDRLSYLSDEQWEAYVKDRRVVRHWQKIKAVRDNVFFVRQIQQEYGSFAQYLLGWPLDDQVGLMTALKKRGARLGGASGYWFLRYVGKDCYTVTPDVVLALQLAGCDIGDKPSSQRDLRKVQEAFDGWHLESQLSMLHISKVAALSVGKNHYMPEVPLIDASS